MGKYAGLVVQDVQRLGSEGERRMSLAAVCQVASGCYPSSLKLTLIEFPCLYNYLDPDIILN
jgi:hypothetical protein